MSSVGCTPPTPILILVGLKHDWNRFSCWKHYVALKNTKGNESYFVVSDWHANLPLSELSQLWRSIWTQTQRTRPEILNENTFTNQCWIFTLLLKVSIHAFCRQSCIKYQMPTFTLGIEPAYFGITRKRHFVAIGRPRRPAAVAAEVLIVFPRSAFSNST